MDTGKLASSLTSAAELGANRAVQLGNQILQNQQLNSSTELDRSSKSGNTSDSNSQKPASFLDALNKVQVGEKVEGGGKAFDLSSKKEFQSPLNQPFEKSDKPLPLPTKNPLRDLDHQPDETTTGQLEETPTNEQEAVQQFVGEAFFGILIKQMRSSVWRSDLMGNSSAQKQFEGQLDQIMVQNLAESSSDRISKPFYEQMQRYRG